MVLKINWNEIPAIRVLIPFITGILLAQNTKPTNFIPTLLVLCISAIVTYLFRNRIAFYWKYYLKNIILFFSLVLIGQGLTISRTSFLYNSHFNNTIKTDQYYIGKITQVPTFKNGIYRFETEISYSVSTKNFIKKCGKVICNLPAKSAGFKPELGDHLLLENYIKSVSENKNPSTFNYRKFLSYKDIYHQILLNKTNSSLISKNTRFNLKFQANKLRNTIVSLNKEFLNNTQNSSFANAILIGFKDELDPELIWAYANSGAIHVLAVSGLHVGLIYMIVFFILGLITKKSNFKYSITLLIIWAYALTVGLPASVFRATIMFSIILVGKLTNQNNNVFNNLGVSALIILLINPFDLFNVGFQLSHLSVLGISLFTTKIHQLIWLKNKYLNKITLLIAVSLAAQLVTFPLGLLFYHQFPTYFLISNLVVIPAVTIILSLNIFSLLFFKIQFMKSLLSLILNFIITTTNELILKIEKLPNSIFTDIDITTFSCIIIYILIILIHFLTEYRNKKLFFTSQFVFLYLVLNFVYDKYSSSIQKQIIVYHTPQKPILGIINSNSIVLIGDSSILFNKAQFKFYIEPSLRIYFIKKIKKVPISKTENHTVFLNFINKNIYFIPYNSKFQKLKTNSNNIVILENNRHLKMYSNEEKVIFLSKKNLLTLPNQYNIEKNGAFQLNYKN